MEAIQALIKAILNLGLLILKGVLGLCVMFIENFFKPEKREEHPAAIEDDRVNAARGDIENGNF